VLISKGQFFELGYFLCSRLNEGTNWCDSTSLRHIFHQWELLRMENSLNYFPRGGRLDRLSVFENLQLLIERHWSPLALDRHPIFNWGLRINMRSLFTRSCDCSLNILRLHYLRMTIFANLRLHHLSHRYLTFLVLGIILQVIFFARCTTFTRNFQYPKSYLLITFKLEFSRT
jgi:hypothetical protein